MDLQYVPPEPEVVPEPTTDQAPATSGIKWRQLRRLGATLFPTSSPFGKPTAFTGSKNFLVVGTYSADILVFAYDQELLMQLNAREATQEMLGAVTHVALSDDESHVVAGFSLGAVALWELRKPHARLVSLVLPSTEGLTREGEGIHKYARNASHLKGTPIVCCGTLKLAGTKTFVSVDASGVVIRHKFKRVMLEYLTRSVRVLGDPLKTRSVLGCSLLGNILAIQTRDLLLVVKLATDSVDNRLVHTVLRIPRSKDLAASHGYIQHACVSLFPPTSERGRLPTLLYSWNNNLKLIDLNDQSALAAYDHSTTIEHVEFLTRDLIVVVSDREALVLSIWGESPSSNGIVVVSSSCPPVIQLSVIYRSIFILGSYDFQVGQLANWADQILTLLNAGKPAEAINLTLNFYHNEGDLSILGLPLSTNARQHVISQALPDLILTALKFSVHFDPDSLNDLMPPALRATVLADPELLNTIADLVEDDELSSKLFYSELSKLAYSGSVTRLPPHVFKQLVTTNPDPVLFYKLDLSTLDLDLAFKLCKTYENALGDVKVYLETQALHDYLSPLQIPSKVFEYLKLILTSRVYPTEEEMPEFESSAAKTVLYNALFLQEHPLYEGLIEHDEQAFFDMLDAAFEDSFLNEDSGINRQIILSLLLVHLDLDSWYFCSFIARNYSKYPQFLAVSDKVLEHVLDILCAKGREIDSETSQLNILCLLSNYKLRDTSRLIGNLLEARYTLVLKSLLSRTQKYGELLQIELDLREPDLWENLDIAFANNRSTTELFVQTNWQELLEFDDARLGAFVATHPLDNSLWKLHDTSLPFLRSVFKTIKNSGGHLPPPHVCANYVNLLAEQSESNELIEVLHSVLDGPCDVELPLVVDTLIAHNRYDALILLMSRRDRNSEAMIYLREYIRENDGLSNTELDRYVDLGAMLCRKEPDVAVSTEMWENLLETLAAKSMHEQVKRLTRIIAESTSVSLPEIVRHMLKDESAINDVGLIISEGYTILTRNLAALQCFYEIIQKENLTELLELIKSKTEGVVVSIDSECEVCGDHIVGLGIDADKAYKDWAAAMRKEPQTDLHHRLLLFRCRHSYHYDCLHRMSPTDLCVVCNELN